MDEWDIVEEKPSRTPEQLIAQSFPADVAPTMLRVAKAESSLKPTATNKNKNGTQDSGLFQINDIHVPELIKRGIIKDKSDLLLEGPNTRAAVFLYQRDGLKPWKSSQHNWGKSEPRKSDDEWDIVAEIPSENGVDPLVKKAYDRSQEVAMMGMNTANQVAMNSQKPPTERTTRVPEWGKNNPNLYGVAGSAYETLKPLIEYGGAVGGAIAGMPSGPVGAVLGSGLGYAGGRRISKIAGQAIGAEGAETPTEALRNTAIDTSTGAQFEMGGQIIGKMASGIVQKAIAPNAKHITPEAEKVVEIAQREGIPLTATDITQKKSWGLVESLLGNAPLSASVVKDFKMGQIKGLMKMRDALVAKNGDPQAIEQLGMKIQNEATAMIKRAGFKKQEQINALSDKLMEKLGSTETYEAVGKKAQEAIANKSQGLKLKSQKMYADVDELVPEGTEIPMNNLQKLATDLLYQETKLPPAMQNGNNISLLKTLAGRKVTSDTGESLIVDAYGHPIPISATEQIITPKFDWQTTQAIRSNMNKQIAAGDAAMGTNAPNASMLSNPQSGLYKQLKKALDSDIQDFANTQGGQLQDVFKLATSTYKESKTLMKDILPMLKANPERVVDIVIRPGEITNIALIKQAIGDKGFAPIKQKFATNLIEKSTVDGAFSGQALEKQMARYGDETLSTVFKPEELKLLKDSAKGAIKIEEHPAASRFYTDLVKNLDRNPEKILDLVIRPNNTKTITLTKAVIGENGWKEVESKFLERLLVNRKGVAGIDGDEMISPDRLTTAIFRYGDDTLRAVFGKENYKAVKEIGMLSKYLGAAEKIAGNPSGTAQNVITWSQGAMLLTNPIMGGVSIVTPAALAKLYLSESGRKYLSLGTRLPAESREGAQVAAKLAIMLRNESKKSEAREDE